MLPRRLLAPLAVTAAVAGGGVAGALLGIPGVSGAQESTTTVPELDAAPDAGPRGPRLHMRGGPFGDVADELGLSVDELMTQLRDGKTIAEIAEAAGVDLDALIDKLVAEAEANLPSEADVRERLTELFNNTLPRLSEGDGGRPDFRGGAGGPGGRGGAHFRHHPGPGLEAAAGALDMTTEELATELRDGKTIAAIAQEKGVDVDTVIDAMVAEASERITDFVNNGPQKPERPAEDSEGS